MTDQLSAIAQFVIESFVHIWPYLLVTIPIAVAVQLSGAAKYINRAFQTRPVVAIFLATFVGAFSPFCSCGVIPVVAALLIGGVPLAPVMAFWIASPSMDPEIFFLSVGTLGWPLAVWRLAATLVLSLSAGFITHLLFQKGWVGARILRENHSANVRSRKALLKTGWQRLKQRMAPALRLSAPDLRLLQMPDQFAIGVPSARPQGAAVTMVPSPIAGPGTGAASCEINPDANSCSTSSCSTNSCSTVAGTNVQVDTVPFYRRLLDETWQATTMVVKFMALAFLLEALITLYIPSEWIVALLGPTNPLAILTAAAMGVPAYTSNLAALPLIGGLLAQGMDPAAALAFLIAGPTTTLPAMAAVWGLASRRVFFLYVAYSLVGAVILGYLYSLIMQ